MDPGLSAQLQDLQSRLRDLEAQEVRPTKGRGVFVSYSHQDSSFVDLLTERLTRDNIDYWRDDKDLLVGEIIDRAISAGIQRHALFLVVVSSSSIRSTWVNRELDEASHEASEGRKVILPVLASGLAVGYLPAHLRRFKCADFSSHFDMAYRLLKRSIDEHLRRATRPPNNTMEPAPPRS
jgi:hypothetical protein